jgi:hypothetical protein
MNRAEESTPRSEHYDGLKSRLIKLYGEETARHKRLFEELRITLSVARQRFVSYLSRWGGD